MRLRRLNRKGVTLVELSIAVAILATMASTVILARKLMAVQTVNTNDRAFATQKTIQMFGELKSLVSGSEQGAAILDNYSDGTTYNLILTTDKNVDVTPVNSGNPANVLSGNIPINGHWRYLRQVSVVPVPNDIYARWVSVKMWRYGSDSSPLTPGTLLSEVAGILRTQTSVTEPSQVMDVYFIDINNVQGWWVSTPQLNNYVTNAVQNVEAAADQSLSIRAHYITRTSYGRDLGYAPYINAPYTVAGAEVTNGTDQAPSSWVYLYPGPAPEDSTGAEVDDFYEPDGTNSGVLLDGAFLVGNATSSVSQTSLLFNHCPNYAVADQYNQSVRYPDEVSDWQAVTTAYTGSSYTPVTDISERMLIEGMLSQPASFENAIVVNLHAEMLPLPPMRNYSDAAKDPGDYPYYPYYRVVTHPDNLFYPASSGTTSVNLRVYGYMDGMDEDNVSSLPSSLSGSATNTMPYANIQVALPGYGNLAAAVSQPIPSGLLITAIYGDGSITYSYETQGGVFNNNETYTFNDFGGAVTNPFNMAVSFNTSSSGATITLFHTPMRCPQSTNGSGLNAHDCLYGLEYIPCSPDLTAWSSTFTNQGLTYVSPSAATTAGYPKNTARWIITLPMSVQTAPGNNYGVGSPQTIQTWIMGGGVSTSVYPNPGTQGSYPNLSQTYVWVGKNNPPPATERYQFIGDPRDCPYLDCKVGGPAVSGASTTILAYSYNWWWKNCNKDGYSGYAPTTNVNSLGGWGGNTGDGINVEEDIPRFYQMIRNGLLNTSSIWATINGWSFYYFGFGGEMGGNQSPDSNGVSYMQAPWATASSGISTVKGTDEILTQTGWTGAGVTYAHLPACLGNSGSTTTDSWFAKAWMGELYPDRQYSTFWQPYGNLPTLANHITNASDPVTFFRELYGNISDTPGNSLYGFHGTTNFGKSTDQGGAPSFFNGTNGGDPFQHTSNGGNNGTLSSLGVTTYNIFSYSLAQSANFNRPWSINQSMVTTPSEWNIGGTNGYSNVRNSLTQPVPSSGTTELFYTSGDSNYTNGSGVVQITNSSGTQSAYVVESGYNVANVSGNMSIATSALLLAMRTFLDGGLIEPSGSPGHITQLPLIQVSVDSLTQQYTNPSSIYVTIASPVVTGGTPSVPVSNVWFRFPGYTSQTGNFYDELYTGYNNLLNSTYSENVTLLYNLKYSPNNGNNWYFLQDNQPATLGAPSTVAAEAVTQNNSNPYYYTWDVSNSTSFPQGQYLLQAEAYREGFGLHYSYHQIEVIIDR